VNGSRVTSSESELVAWLRAEKSLGLVGVDGANRSGKTRLARRLAAELDCPLIECDLFIRNGTLPYPRILDLKCLASVVSAATVGTNSAIVESVMLRLVLDAIVQVKVFHVYVRHSWPVGCHTHRDLFDPERTERDLIAAENALCQAVGIDDDAPILARELIHYHKRYNPHENAHILYEVAFAPCG